jgi:hypothetical protein
MHRLALVIAVLVVTVTGSAYAEDGPEQHRGFLFRVQSGSGYSFLTGKGNQAHRMAVPLRLDFGGAVAENVILHGDLVWDVGVAVGDDDAGLSLVAGAALGATWYLMPENYYVEADVGFAAILTDEELLECLMLTEEQCEERREREEGPGLLLGVGAGREWWVSDNWGLGVGARVNVGVSRGYSAVDALLTLTATYN